MPKTFKGPKSKEGTKDVTARNLSNKTRLGRTTWGKLKTKPGNSDYQESHRYKEMLPASQEYVELLLKEAE